MHVAGERGRNPEPRCGRQASRMPSWGAGPAPPPQSQLLPLLSGTRWATSRGAWEPILGRTDSVPMLHSGLPRGKGASPGSRPFQSPVPPPTHRAALVGVTARCDCAPHRRGESGRCGLWWTPARRGHGPDGRGSPRRWERAWRPPRRGHLCSRGRPERPRLPPPSLTPS